MKKFTHSVKISYGAMRKCLPLLLMMVTGGMAHAFSGGNYTINQTAAASATNYRSFTAFINDLQNITRGDGGSANYSVGGAGVQGNITVDVVVGSGPYTEQINIPAITGMTSTSRTVTINGNGETIQFSPTATNVYVIRLSGADYFRFYNLKVVGTNATYGWGIHLYNSSDYNIFDNVEIDLTAVTSTTTSNSVGFALNSNTTTLQQQNGANGQRNLIQNCFIHGGASGGPFHGVVFCGTSGTQYNNRFINNRIEDFYAYGFHCSAIGGAMFKNNKVSRPKRTTGTTLYGWYIINNVNPLDTFDGNYITNMFGGMSTSTLTCYGINWATPNVPAASPCLIYNNVMANWGGRGARVAFQQTYGGNIHYYHNTISFDDDVANSGSGTWYGLYVQLGPGPSNYKNNIISMVKPTSGTAYAFYNATAGNAYPNDYNVYNLRSGYNYGYDASYAAYNSLSGWQTATGRDMNSKAVDPGFNNLATLDLNPTSSSVIAMAPAIAGITRDINGNLRGGNTNPGAFELLSDINIVAATLDNASICNGYTDGLTATVKNEGPLANASNIIIGYSINNVHQYWDTVKGPVAMGSSVNHKFKKGPLFTQRGLNTVKVYTLLKDLNSANDQASTSMNVLGTPTGSQVTYGVVEHGIKVLGTSAAPDVIFPQDTFEYNISEPAGFLKATYGSAWSMQAVLYDGASVVNTSNYQYIPFTSLNDAKIRFLVSPTLENKKLQLVLTVKETSVNNCDTVFSRWLIVGPKGHPGIKVLGTNFCNGDEVVFNSTSTVSSGILSLNWDFGDGESEQDNPGPAHKYAQPGTYNVKLTITTVPYGYVTDTMVTVTVFERPVANFSVVNACEGIPVKFTNLTTISAGSPTYEWDFGDGSSVSILKNPSKLYTPPGKYSVTLTATSNGCKSVVSHNAYQFQKPKPAFTVSSPNNCDNEVFEFTNKTTLGFGEYGVRWSFGENNNIATEYNPMYDFASAGNKSVKLLAISEFGCTDSVTQTVTVKPAPVSGFINAPACDGNPTQFNNTTVVPGGTNASYTWNFGDGTPTSNVPSPLHPWLESGAKNVTLKTVLDNGCSAEISKQLLVGVQPKANFDVADQCANKQVSFENLSTWENGTISFQWDFGDGNLDNSVAPVYKYNTSSSQTYNVKLVAEIAGGCKDSVVKTVTVHALPATCDFDIVYDGVAGHRNYKFQPKGGLLTGVNYRWLTGDGANKTSVAAGINYNYKSDGKYLVTMVARNSNDCECSQTKLVNINWSSVNSIEAMDALVNVYPNPNNGRFTVVIDGEVNNVAVKVFTLTGELIKTQTAESNSFEMDMTDYAAGMYLVKLYSGNTVVTKMVTINR